MDNDEMILRVERVALELADLAGELVEVMPVEAADVHRVAAELGLDRCELLLIAAAFADNSYRGVGQ